MNGWVMWNAAVTVISRIGMTSFQISFKCCLCLKDNNDNNENLTDRILVKKGLSSHPAKIHFRMIEDGEELRIRPFSLTIYHQWMETDIWHRYN